MTFLRKSRPIATAEARAASAIRGRARKRPQSTHVLERTDSAPPAGVPAKLDEPLEPGLLDVKQRLAATGTSAELIEEILSDIQASGARGAYAIDAAARSIASTFRVMGSPKRSRNGAAHLIAFVGPAGGGKTSCLAKLARRLMDAGRRVLCVSLDAVGLTALETVGGIEADVDRTELPLMAVRNVADMRELLRATRDIDVVLIDTPGLSGRDEVRIDLLGRELSRILSLSTSDTYLVLPSVNSRSSTDLAIQSFERLQPSAAVLTRLDESPEPVPVLEATHEAGLPIAFFCDGQDVRAHLSRPTSGYFADLLLRGKMA